MTTGYATKRAEVAWLTDTYVPTDWKSARIKYLTRGMRAGEAIESERIRDSGSIPVYGGNGVRGFTEDATHSGMHVLIGRQGALCGNIHLADGSFWASEHAIVCSPVSGVDARWLAYMLHAMNLGQYSVSAAQPGIGVAQVAALETVLPSLEEQRHIADFLDAETGKMDAMLRAQSRMHELLDERINHQILAVIGRSCLGDRIAGEPVLAMRWLLDKQVRPTSKFPEVITAFRDGQVTARSMRRAEGYTNSASSDPQGQAVRIDDVVVHGLDGFAGAIGTSEAEGNCSPVYHVLTPKRGGDALYYGRMLRILALQEYLTGFSFSTRERAFDFRNWDMFGRIPIPVASLFEQQHIGEQIRKVRPLREKFEQFGKLLAERRQSLITAAVTGQFDVSTASGRNVTE